SRKRCVIPQRPGLVSSTCVEVPMPNNVCQHCQMLLQPVERGVCGRCFTRCLWEYGWPAIRALIHHVLPAERLAALGTRVAQQCRASWVKTPMVGLASSFPLHRRVKVAHDAWRFEAACQEESRRFWAVAPLQEQLAVRAYFMLAYLRLARRYTRR